MPESIGFIGLGNLGLPIAQNLLASGFALRVFNRTGAKAEPLAARGATIVNTPGATAPRGGMVFSIVSDDAALTTVASDQFAEALGPNGIHVSMSTVSPATAARLSEHHARFGAVYVAAPVFGRPEAAAARKLWICASGPSEAKKRAQPAFDAIGQGVFDFGEAPGAANVMKLAGNFLIMAMIEAMAEMSAFAEKNGVSRGAALDMLNRTIFNSPVFNNYSKKLTDADFDKVGFALPLALKDMTLARQTASASAAPMPILNLLCDRYLSAMAKGREKLDATALALGAGEDAGIKW